MPQTARYNEHEEHKKERSLRFEKKIYGVVQEPIIPVVEPGMIWDPPTYLVARRTASHSATVMNDGIDRKLDMRCFYTGIICDPQPSRPAPGYNIDPRVLPWVGTRDHLVPARRDVPGCPIDVSKYPSTLVWSSNVANVTLGLSPLLVRLKIRQWLMTIPIDRDDRSVEAGLNLRWLIIKLVNEFRLKGRYPWSRNTHGQWWYPEISDPFMSRAWMREQEFLWLNELDRNDWINKFNWQF